MLLSFKAGEAIAIGDAVAVDEHLRSHPDSSFLW